MNDLFAPTYATRPSLEDVSGFAKGMAMSKSDLLEELRAERIASGTLKSCGFFERKQTTGAARG